MSEKIKHLNNESSLSKIADSSNISSDDGIEKVKDVFVKKSNKMVLASPVKLHQKFKSSDTDGINTARFNAFADNGRKSKRPLSMTLRKKYNEDDLIDDANVDLSPYDDEYNLPDKMTCLGVLYEEKNKFKDINKKLVIEKIISEIEDMINSGDFDLHYYKQIINDELKHELDLLKKLKVDDRMDRHVKAVLLRRIKRRIELIKEEENDENLTISIIEEIEHSLFMKKKDEELSFEAKHLHTNSHFKDYDIEHIKRFSEVGTIKIIEVPSGESLSPQKPPQRKISSPIKSPFKPHFLSRQPTNKSSDKKVNILSVHSNNTINNFEIEEGKEISRYSDATRSFEKFEIKPHVNFGNNIGQNYLEGITSQGSVNLDDVVINESSIHSDKKRKISVNNSFDFKIVNHDYIHYTNQILKGYYSAKEYFQKNDLEFLINDVEYKITQLEDRLKILHSIKVRDNNEIDGLPKEITPEYICGLMTERNNKFDIIIDFWNKELIEIKSQIQSLNEKFNKEKNVSDKDKNVIITEDTKTVTNFINYRKVLQLRLLLDLKIYYNLRQNLK